MGRYHGKAGAMYLSTTGSGAAASLTVSEWSLNLATDRVETTSMQDTNKTFVQGLKNIEGTLSGFFDETDTKLWTGSDSTDGVKIYLYPSTNAATHYWYGPAWIDGSIANSVSGAVTFSGTFAANGAWGKKP